MKPLLSVKQFEQLLAELERPLQTTFRINTLKTNIQEIRDLADRYGWDLEAIPYCPTGFRLRAAKTPLSKTLEHRMGHLYIQEAASMFPVELFDLTKVKEPLVLDMAASPGGKTTHLIARIGDAGLVIANDYSAARIQALRLNLQNSGAIQQAVTCAPGEVFGRQFANTFDLVLLDAPCSMEGLRTSDAHPLRPITDRERTQLARRQHNLLVSAIHAAKPGGQIVYSTCTLAPEEDELVLQSVIDILGDQIQIDPVQLPSGIPSSALLEYQGKRLDPQMSRAFRLWPHIFRTAGFFAARISKNFASERQPGDTIYSETVNLRGPISDQERTQIVSFFRDRYGFELEQSAMREKTELRRNNSIVTLVPCDLNRFLPDIRPVSAGLKIGQDSPDGFIPSHDFVSRFQSGFQTGIYTLPQDLSAAWLRGEDLRGVRLSFPLHSIAIVRDELDRYVGIGKVLADRVKNLLPRRVVL